MIPILFKPPPAHAWAVTGAALFDGGQWHHRHALIIRKDRIVQLLPDQAVPIDLPRVDFGDHQILPGLIDLQVNGAGGYLLNPDFTVENLRQVQACNFRNGCTRFLPTLITSPPKVLRSALEVTKACLQSPDMPVPSMLGMHLEGPYLNRIRAGIHPKCWIRRPDATELEWIEEFSRYIRLLTIAPERLSPGLLRHFLSLNIPLSLGHSNATFEQAQQAFESGVVAVTHLFNALPPLLSREPGAVGAALANANAYVGVIADGHHVHPSNLELIYRLKPKRWILVTDGTPASGSKILQFRFAHKRIFVDKQNRCTDQKGRLAGSSLTMLEALQFAVKRLGIPLGEVSKACSKHPAEVIGFEKRLGHLAPGYLADLIVLGKDLTLKFAVCGGKVVFQSHELKGLV